MLVYKGKPEKSWSQHNKVGVPSSFEVGRGVNFLPKNLKGERFLTIDFISSLFQEILLKEPNVLQRKRIIVLSSILSQIGVI